ncbi:MAG: Maf family protein [Anaerosomatales bacterium]|nr:Maf family protein [Anaerosomatales bacterium]MDT8433664.1 Maf family protein [Anaerosomatales bacterium]
MCPVADNRLILASASPRRRRLLAMLGLEHLCTSADTPEDLDTPLAADPPALAAALAAEKAVAARDAGASGPVLAFDTVVVHDGRVLGKPADIAEAYEMLRSLSGATHRVVTGMAILAPGAGVPETSSVTTPVRMCDLTEHDIDTWAAHGELLGCAGAYNIESHLARVDDDQCFQNVAGLPLCHLYLALQRMHDALGIGKPVVPVGPCNAARNTRCQLGPRLMEGDVPE